MLKLDHRLARTHGVVLYIAATAESSIDVQEIVTAFHDKATTTRSNGRCGLATNFYAEDKNMVCDVGVKGLLTSTSESL